MTISLRTMVGNSFTRNRQAANWGTPKKVFILIVALLVACLSGCPSLKPVYNDTEQAIAEAGVNRFHEFHNAQSFYEIYDLMDETVRASTPKEQNLGNNEKDV